MEQNETDILYHYTDFSALDGILSHAELRLNNVLNMNDAAEMNLFMSGLCRAAADRFRREGADEKARLTRRIFLTEQKNRFSYSAYAACFSRYRDDAAQWERYGNRGRGVCIAFRGDLLARMAAGALSLEAVQYQVDVSDHPLAEELHALLAEAEAADGQTPALRNLLNRAWVTSAVYKHPSFASENEVRLVVSPFERAYFDVEPRYHITRDRIKKYYPLDLGQMCGRAGIGLEDLIPELMIGPESTQSLPILQDYLHGLHFCRLAEHVFLSDCPLRQRG